MKKNILNSMDLNRETAMRLWNNTFGKEIKAIDFAGRKIAKSAYNDRNSEFGWNVDHILPQSKGGVTADYNLICCHILTNDDKADKFPCFTTNEIKFEIIKVQNHYEIRKVDNKDKKANDINVNFFDSASGIRFFKDLLKEDSQRFVGTVQIELEGVSNYALYNFIKEIYKSEDIIYLDKNDHSKYSNTILIKDYNLPKKNDISTLLDKCVLLNTYLKNYFLSKKTISKYRISFFVEVFNNFKDMYLSSLKKNKDQIKSLYDYWNTNSDNTENSLIINEIVKINTEANTKATKIQNNEYLYDFVFTNLNNNLIKEVSGK